MQGGEFAAEPGQRAEQLQVPGQRQAREIYLQKLRVAAPVAGTVKHRVGVVEDVFGRKAGGQAMRRNPDPKRRSENFYELRSQVESRSSRFQRESVGCSYLPRENAHRVSGRVECVEVCHRT